MAGLKEGGGVIRIGGCEAVALWKGGSGPRCVARPNAGQNPLSPRMAFPFGQHGARRCRRHAFNLTGVEHRFQDHARLLQFRDGLDERTALIVKRVYPGPLPGISRQSRRAAALASGLSGAADRGRGPMRESRSIERRIRSARFPVIKTLDDVDRSWPKKINLRKSRTCSGWPS